MPVPRHNATGSPWERDLHLLESTDGPQFGNSKRFVTGGGVASIVRDAKGRLIAAFQWFPRERGEYFDRIAVRNA